jgi:MSHA biogenesis protein MshP
MSRPSLAHFRSLRRNAGVGLVTAIFLLVVLAALGVAMVTLSTAQQSGAAFDRLGSMAYQAARAGNEYGVYQVLRNAGNCPAATSFAMPAGTSLSTFTVTVTCTRIDGPTPATAVALRRFSLKSTACNQPAAGACPNASGGADYVQRVIEAKI